MKTNLQKNTQDKIFNLIDREGVRQKEMIGLIPSENHCSPEVCRALGVGALTSKYSEGYPGARYYEGNEIIDEILKFFESAPVQTDLTGMSRHRAEGNTHRVGPVGLDDIDGVDDIAFGFGHFFPF